jgi:hypothetical protein
MGRSRTVVENELIREFMDKLGTTRRSYTTDLRSKQKGQFIFAKNRKLINCFFGLGQSIGE